MTQLQTYIFEELQVFDKFCRDNNLTYILLGGSMLGAVRHKGFIPWDDDADVGMPRKDYEKFLELAPKNIPDPYIIRHFSLEKNIPYSFIHIENTKTTYIEERRSGKNYKGGVYIEIFPLDFESNNFTQRTKHFKKIKFLKKLLYIQIMPKKALGKNPIKKIIWFLVNTFTNMNKTTRKIDKILQIEKNDKQFYGNLLGHWGLKENFSAEVLFPAKEYEFEKTKFYGVNNYDKYLSQMYGDYMTPPKETEIKDYLHEAVLIDFEKPYI